MRPVPRVQVLLWRTQRAEAVQRLEAVSRSPIFAQFSETLNGLSTIRAFGATERFARQSIELVARNTRCEFNKDIAVQWVSLRLDFISGVISAMTILLPIVTIQVTPRCHLLPLRDLPPPTPA